MARTLAPAIALARDGFALDPRFAKLAEMRERFLRAGSGAQVFLDNGKAPQPGFRLRQPELADTLELIAAQGRDGFYRGRIAAALVAGANATGGVWSMEDLTDYKVIERAPVRFVYRGATITTAALPSGGGVTLAQSLNILEQFALGDVRAPETAHTQAARRAPAWRQWQRPALALASNSPSDGGAPGAVPRGIMPIYHAESRAERHKCGYWPRSGQAARIPHINRRNRRFR